MLYLSRVYDCVCDATAHLKEIIKWDGINGYATAWSIWSNEESIKEDNTTMHCDETQDYSKANHGKYSRFMGNNDLIWKSEMQNS